MQDTNKFMELLQRDVRFNIESYKFVNEALEYAQKQNQTENSQDRSVALEIMIGQPRPHHISGQDLSRAVRDFALEQYGLMARHVLANLGIRKTGDIGDIVYNMIDIGFMNKTDSDSREDFDNVFDLARDLEHGFSFKN